MVVSDVDEASRPNRGEDVQVSPPDGRFIVQIGDNDGMVNGDHGPIQAGDPVYLNPDGSLVGVAVSDENINADNQPCVEVSPHVRHPVEGMDINVDLADGSYYMVFSATETIGRVEYNLDGIRNLRPSTPGQ